MQKASRALREFRIDGVATNIPFLAAILAHPDFVANRISTGFIETHIADLVGAAENVESLLVEDATRSRRAGRRGAISRGSCRLGRRRGAAAGHCRQHRVAEGDRCVPASRLRCSKP